MKPKEQILENPSIFNRIEPNDLANDGSYLVDYTKDKEVFNTQIDNADDAVYQWQYLSDVSNYTTAPTWKCRYVTEIEMPIEKTQVKANNIISTYGYSA